MGADVIKVEQPNDEEGTSRHHFDFQNLHRNKRSLVLNLKDERGKDILKKLVRDADVLVENYRPAVKKRLGIDYEALRPLNPRLGLRQHLRLWPDRTVIKTVPAMTRLPKAWAV